MSFVQSLMNFLRTNLQRICGIQTSDLYHQKARSIDYPSSETKRFVVPDDKVLWSIPFPEYKPVEYTHPSVLKGPVWADPDNSTSKQTKDFKELKFNGIDGAVNRKSFHGPYKIDKNGLPINPKGRTGIKGRGLLGKWGPNHAADPIVTRWKKDQQEKRILQFVAIQRKDTKEWALPGGMVDGGEEVSVTLKREFGEEALNSLETSEAERKELETQIAKIFKHGTKVYKGYCDDPRNTDNAWMETVAMNFHDETGKSVGSLPLHAGDDAGAVCWMDVDSNLKLYASHEELLKKTAKLHKAHW